MGSRWIVPVLTIPAALFAILSVGCYVCPDIAYGRILDPLVRSIGNEGYEGLSIASYAAAVIAILLGSFQVRTRLLAACVVLNGLWLAFIVFTYATAYINSRLHPFHMDPSQLTISDRKHSGASH
jgi:hypothetical protein